MFVQSISVLRILLGASRRSFGNPPSMSVSPFQFRVSGISNERRCGAYCGLSVMAGEIPSSDLDPMRTYQVVVAATRDMGIGKDGKLPWKLPSDLKFFKELTVTTSDYRKMNAVVMGRKTWESIPPKFLPLPGRLNVVITRYGTIQIDDDFDPRNVVVCRSFPLALKLLAEEPYCLSIEKVFVIGGGQILREALNAPGCDAIHITEIESSIECDTFIPGIDFSLFRLWYSSMAKVENNIRFSFATYVRMRNADSTSNEVHFSFLPDMIFEKHNEYVYLRMVEELVSNGVQRDDQRGVSLLSKFGCQMLRFNLRKSFPLLTTKRVFWQGVVEELLGVLSGSTKQKITEDVRLRDRNASKDYLDSIGFERLSDIIGKIKNQPNELHTIVTADTGVMAAPPSHVFAQFYVANGKLSCQTYHCSADMGLGMPHNIASYSLLTCVIAHVCGLVPGDFIHVIGDARVRQTHIGPLQEQLRKLPKPFPILRINPQKTDSNSFLASDFELIGYDPHEDGNENERVEL